MNQIFKLKYDEMKEGNPAHEEPSSEYRSKAYEEFYPEESHTRNVCFVWLDGKRIFMNYSYLVSGEYSPETNTITLSFTTHAFILKGVNLESLFYDIMHQLSKQITCVDARYNLIGEGEKPVVNEISIKNL
jgi:hypothetical protein